MLGSTIKIFLADGTPLGLRVIEKSNWSGRGFDFARADWPRVRPRDEFGHPGVYVLSGLDDDGQSHVYIGEADELRTRLNQHNAGSGSKAFWERAVAFTSKDENLNKAHVRFLEARLVALAQAAKRVTLENSNVPAQPALSEYDRAEAEAFLVEMLLIYPLLGIDAFEQPAVKPEPEGMLSLVGRGVTAQGRDTSSGFVVLKGSRAAKTEAATLSPFMRTRRQALVSIGVLVLEGETFLLTQDYAFSSPSTAAGVMLGRSANGLTEWRRGGKTLKAIREAAGAG